MQTTSRIAMVRPAAFGYNTETAVNNFFQDASLLNDPQLHQSALVEFNAMLILLRANGVEVLVLEDNESPAKPDAIFPNNWFSCNNAAIHLFPMHARNRRHEKRMELVDQIKSFTGLSAVLDWSEYEAKELFLEGTGSMVLDHVNRIIYACLSSRTSATVLYQYANTNNYTAVVFEAADQQGNEIYHTNVMMCIGTGFAVICAEAIKEEGERKRVLDKLINTGHSIIPINFAQLNAFAGNMLQLHNMERESLLIMSSTAFNSLMQDQVEALKKYARLVVADVSTIEKASGGSVRCMIAELFS